MDLSVPIRAALDLAHGFRGEQLRPAIGVTTTPVACSTARSTADPR
jgi:hypothetical protein